MTQQQFEKLEKDIEKLMESSVEPLHSIDHLRRVAGNSVKIAKILNLENKIDMNLLRAACLLHDVPKALTPMTVHGTLFMTNFFESSLDKKMLPGILEKLDIDEEDKKIIFEAVINHPLSFPYRQLNKRGNNYTKILQDADTFDLFSEFRLKTFSNIKHKYRLYNFASPFVNIYKKFGLMRLSWFLNYPELSSHTDEIYS